MHISGTHDEPLVQSPALVVGRVGADCGNVYLSDGPAWITDNAIYSSIVPQSVNLAFWRLAISRCDIRARAKGGGQPFVSQETLSSLIVPLPSSLEQELLVQRYQSAIESVEELLTSCGKVSTSFKLLEQAILASAFRGELVPQDPNDEPAAAMLARLRADSIPVEKDQAAAPAKQAARKRRS